VVVRVANTSVALSTSSVIGTPGGTTNRGSYEHCGRMLPWRPDASSTFVPSASVHVKPSVQPRRVSPRYDIVITGTSSERSPSPKILTRIP
jgi:hypothetical protein